MYTNPVTQGGAMNNNFGAVSQTDLTRVEFLSVAQAISEEL